MNPALAKFIKPTPFKAGVLCVLLSCLYYLSFAGNKPLLLQSLDNQVTSSMFHWRGKQTPQQPVIIVDIDEKSLSQQGQWPWPRNQVADLIEKIQQQGAKVIGLDIMFIEADRTSPTRLIENYPELSESLGSQLALLDHDKLLGDRLAETESVLGYAMISQNDGLKKAEQQPFPSANLAVANSQISFNQLQLMPVYRAAVNQFDIAQGKSEGFLNFFPESSGTVHKVPLLLSLDGTPYPSMALEVARIAMQHQTITLHSSDTVQGEKHGLIGISIGDQFIPTDDQGQMSINFRGPWRSFEYISAVDLLKGKKFPQMNNAIILIGTSATGLLDLQTTPFSHISPGVEIHANIIDNLISGDPLKHDIFTEIGITFSLIIIGGLSLSFLLAHSGALIGAIGGGILLSIMVVGNYLFLFKNASLIGITYPLITLIVISLVVTLSNYLMVERQKQFIQGAFRHYLAPQVVEQLLQNPDQLTLSGQEKELTVMFSDIRNFTSISEKMDSVALANFMNRYLTEMGHVIMGGQGMIDKFIGDAIMAIWGTPVEDPEHALKAVISALQMKQLTAELREQWLKEDLPAIHIGIGLNTGPMRVGNFGSEQVFNYTVIGDQVNLASRLEGLNKAYGTTILISENTKNQLGEKVTCRPIDLVRVKGKLEAVEIFEPLCLGRHDSLELIQWQKALKLYRQQGFDDAKQVLVALNEHTPEKLYQLYLDRIKQFLIEPPGKDWDGCFTFSTK